MFEKVNMSHPDKMADRIAGALVDEAYRLNDNPKIAVEVLLGHGVCHIIAETSETLNKNFVYDTVHRICEDDNIYVLYDEYEQDRHLADNQENQVRCGDNGIFKGMPVTAEQQRLTQIAKNIYEHFPKDGKYILQEDTLTICQSNATKKDIHALFDNDDYNLIINPLGFWTGGPSVDTGATNRKLGSDMGDSVTGGGLMGKDISKADVSVNIYAWLKAQELGHPVEYWCSIGDEIIDGKPYSEIVKIAKDYIDSLGGFEAFAEWGLIR